MGQTNKSYIYLAYFSLFTLGIIDNSRGPVYPEILEQFQVSTAVGSTIFSLSSLTSFLITLFASRWGNALGAVNSLKWAVATHLLAVIMMGISGKYVNGFTYFLVASALFGIGVGMMSISLNLIVNKFSPVLQRRKYFAGLHSMYGLASLIAPLLMSFVFKFEIKWQDFLLVLAVIPLAILIYGSRLEKQDITTNEVEPVKRSLGFIMGLGIIFAFYVASEVMVSSRMVLYLRQVWNFSPDKASEYLSLFFLLLLTGRMIFAFFHIPISAYRLLLISSVCSFISFLLGLYWHPFFLAFSGLTMSFYFPNAMEWVSHKYGEEAEALITKIMIYVGGMLVSMHWLVGTLSTLVTIQNAMLLGPFMLLWVIYLLHRYR
jgi:FHS family glucose/mannose:H+ symporter-like MFS transporter